MYEAYHYAPTRPYSDPSRCKTYFYPQNPKISTFVAFGTQRAKIFVDMMKLNLLSIPCYGLITEYPKWRPTHLINSSSQNCGETQRKSLPVLEFFQNGIAYL